MSKLEQVQAKHVVKERKQPLIEVVLGKIKEIESRDDRRETDAIKPFKQEGKKAPKKSDNKAPEKAKKEKSENDSKSYRIDDGHEDIKRFEKDAKEAEKEIKELAKLVAKKRPKLEKHEQIVIAEELFEAKSDGKDHRIQDEIAMLRILLDNEEYRIRESKADADSSYASGLTAKIAELASLL